MNQVSRVAAIVAIGSVLLSSTALAQTLDQKINTLQSEIAGQNQHIAGLRAEGDTLRAKIASLNDQVAQISSQIAGNNAKSQKLTADIEAAQTQMQAKKAILAENVRRIYQTADVSSLEIIVSSNNFSEFFDKQAYLDRLKEHVQESARAIAEIKKALDAQQVELQGVLAAQQIQRQALNAAKSEQQSLLAQTQGEEAAYQRLVASNKAKLTGLYAQRASADAANGVSVLAGGDGGYPWANACTSFTSNCVDPYNYYYRQCVSFAAWYRINKGGGIYKPYGWGNAGEWINHAPHDKTPAVGAIVVWPANSEEGVGWAGHVAIVIAVHGSTFDVAEYNWRPFAYTTRYGLSVGQKYFIH